MENQEEDQETLIEFLRKRGVQEDHLQAIVEEKVRYDAYAAVSLDFFSGSFPLAL